MINLRNLFNRLILGVLILPVACSTKDDVSPPPQKACTMEYRIVSIEVTGDSLTDYFTIRSATGDTLRFEREFSGYDNLYPVLTDDWQSELEGKTEEFRFIGFVGIKKMVNEPFEIRADECHIERVSGNTEVEIDERPPN